MLAACADPPTSAPPAATGRPNFAAAAAGERPRETRLTSLDAAFGEYAASVPGFGGFALDTTAEQTLVVSLVDVGRGESARAALARGLRGFAIGRGRTLADLPIRFRKVDYDFAQLVAWKALVGPIVREGGIQSVDADEWANRVHVGVVDDAARDRVRARLLGLGVPAGALVVEVVPADQEFAQSLTDAAPTKMGGYSVGQGGQGPCTIGINATFWVSGTPHSVFVTNSHCTERFGGVNLSLPFYQPAVNGTVVGYEFADRATFPCPEATRCRNSDAAYVEYAPGVSHAWSFIAHTTSRGTAAGTLAVGGAFDASGRVRFPEDLGANTPTPITNLMLDKVGAATGWTYGRMVRTCQDRGTASGVWLYCQDVFRAPASGGDSGSPVFQYFGNGQTDVWPAGVVHGGSPSIDEYVFSRLSRIEMDNGTLVVY
jgi:hypothetical protein